MNIILSTLLAFISFVGFIIVLWKKPVIPYRKILIFFTVIILGFAIQQALPAKDKFLKLDDRFILLREKTDSNNSSDYHQFVYGTNLSVKEVRDYFKSEVEKIGILNIILRLTPLWQIIGSKFYNEFGDTEKAVLLDIQYGLGNSVNIDITPASTEEKNMGYQTSVFMQYSILKMSAGIRSHGVMLLWLFMGVLVTYFILISFIRTTKKYTWNKKVKTPTSPKS